MTSPFSEERAAPVTVAELLHLPPLANARLLAGQDRTAAQVSSVTLIDRLDSRYDSAPGSAVVLGGEAGSGGWTVEIGLRAAWQRAASCVIAPVGEPGEAGTVIATSMTSLADRLGVPLIGAPLEHPSRLVVDLALLVMRPTGTRAHVTANVVRQLVAAPREPRPLLAVLNRYLPATQVALLAQDGTMIAGRAPAAERASTLPELSRGRHLAGGGWILVHPVHEPDEHAQLHLVATLSQRVDAWGDVVADALAVAAGPLAAWAAAGRLTAERDARLRGALITELLSDTDVTCRHTVVRATRLGWRLDGWHTGIHMALVTRTDPQSLPARTPALESALAGAGLSGPVVERADGWSMWIHHDEEPATRVAEQLMERLRHALAARPADLVLAGGVGMPGFGVAGLRASLVSAREAALLAVTAGVGAVEQSRELGLRRLLITPLGSDGFRALASRLLEPLASGDDEALFETFAAYLDSGCSSSDTASRLRVHRNTVTRRVERAVDLLGIDLGHAEERLAAHLACHAVRVGSTPAP